MDASWNYVYYGYSHEKKEVYGAVYFTNSDKFRSVVFSNVLHYTGKDLKFNLGRCWDGNRQANGHYT